MADAPKSPLSEAPPGAGDDTASSDPLVEGLHAVRDTPAEPGGSDIAADDAGATAMAEKLGDTIRKG